MGGQAPCLECVCVCVLAPLLRACVGGCVCVRV